MHTLRASDGAPARVAEESQNRPLLLDALPRQAPDGVSAAMRMVRRSAAATRISQPILFVALF